MLTTGTATLRAEIFPADLDPAAERVHASGWPVEDNLRMRPWGLRDFRIHDPKGYYLRVMETSGG